MKGLTTEPGECDLIGCSNPLPIPRAGQVRYCSEKCRNLSKNGRRRVKYTKEVDSAPVESESILCKRQACGKMFRPVGARHVYCSDECARKPFAPATQQEAKKLPAHHTRAFCKRAGCYERVSHKGAEFCSVKCVRQYFRPKPKVWPVAAVTDPGPPETDAELRDTEPPPPMELGAPAEEYLAAPPGTLLHLDAHGIKVGDRIALEPVLRSHAVLLRPGLPVMVEVPDDLTAADVDVLTAWLRARLPAIKVVDGRG